MKKWLPSFAAGLLLIAALILPASAKTVFPNATETFFVNDFAGVLTDEQEKELYLLGRQLYEKTTAQVVVVTVKSLEGLEIRDYGYQLASKWGIGDAEKKNGILLLLSTDDRQVDIEVGYGLEGALPDGKCGRILDTYAMPDLKVDRFGAGLEKAYKALINEVYIEYDLEPDPDYVPIDELTGEDDGAIGVFITLLMMVFIVMLISGRSRRHFPFLPFVIANSIGNNGSDSTNHFGGFSGGSFGGFSGGGGSFGGGGASRGF